MALITTLNTQPDFTGEFPAEYAKSGLWRFNESTVDDDDSVSDSSGCGRSLKFINWSGTTADLTESQKGHCARINISNPTTEKSYLYVENDGSIFENIGERIIVGGWVNPTIYSVGNTYCPIFNTRNGPGQPILYLSLYSGRPRLMLYDSSGSLILDETLSSDYQLSSGVWYFIAAVIEPDNGQAWYVIGDKDASTVQISDVMTFTGTLNPSCTADLIWGMHSDTYYYAGFFDDWFLDVDSELTAEDLKNYFLTGLLANGGVMSGDVDALTDSPNITLRATGGVYPTSGILYTRAVKCNLSGSGQVTVSCESVPGTTAVTDIQTSTSGDLEAWSEWIAVGTNGEMESPNAAYIRFRMTLTTTDTNQTPKITGIQLYGDTEPPEEEPPEGTGPPEDTEPPEEEPPEEDTEPPEGTEPPGNTARPAYEKLGYARPVVLDESGAWEAVLENAYDIILTGEVNGEDTLSFSIPFQDDKRSYIDNEKKIQIVEDIYIIRTVTDTRGTDGTIITSVYAEAEFYDLAYSVRKEEKEFDAATADEAMVYALEGTEWRVGTVTVFTLRTWTCSETNALSILREVADLHGGDLVFDCPNRLVHLYTFSGTDSGALFSYRKNMRDIERTVDTTSLVTRLYAYGADGMTFADINDGKAYVEDFTYSSEVRISSLDCSSFTNPYQMLEYTRMRLADYCKPNVSYVLNAMDLSVLTDYAHEAWALGDYVRAEDKDLGISVTTRVVRREYNLQEPWNTVLELSTTLKNLGDTLADAVEGLSGAGDVSSADLASLVPFNHLLNSRADNDMAYWTNSGFEADAENGVSGTASFKAEGAADTTKSMSQTVYPANCSTYTISAQIGSEDLEKLSDNSQVGIEVIIEYEDGTTESRFIDLY